MGTQEVPSKEEERPQEGCQEVGSQEVRRQEERRQEGESQARPVRLQLVHGQGARQAQEVPPQHGPQGPLQEGCRRVEEGQVSVDFVLTSKVAIASRAWCPVLRRTNCSIRWVISQAACA